MTKNKSDKHIISTMKFIEIGEYCQKIRKTAQKTKNLIPMESIIYKK